MLKKAILAVMLVACASPLQAQDKTPEAVLIEQIEQLLKKYREPPVEEPPPDGDAILVPAGGDVQAALDAAPSGARVELAPGTEYAIGTLRFSKPVTLTTTGWAKPTGERATSTDVPQMATTRGGNMPAWDVTPGTLNVLVRGVRVVANSQEAIVLCGHADTSQTAIEQVPRHIAFDQVIVEADVSARRGIALHCADATVSNSSILNINRPGDESSGIGGWNGPGPFTITNNYIEAAAQNVFFGGATPAITGVIPSDILIQRNHLTKRESWARKTDAGMWTSAGFGVKNAFELKVGQRVTFDNNLAEYVWADGQPGWAIVLTPSLIGTANSLEDITITNNVIRKVGCGFNILGVGQNNVTGQSKRITIRNNHVETEGGVYGCHGWFMQLGLGMGPGLVIEHNTINMIDGPKTNSRGNQIITLNGPPVVGARFVGNLVKRSGAYGFWVNVDGTNYSRGARLLDAFPGGVFTGNVLGSFPTPANLPNNLHLPSSAIEIDADGYGTASVSIYGRQKPVQ